MAVSLKENERLFGDSALGMVRALITPAAVPATERVCLSPGLLSELGGFFLLQSIRTPKVAFRYFQDLLGKRIDNPHVSLYQSRFPEHELVKDERRQTVVFKLSQ